MARKLGVPQTAGAWNFIVPPGDAPIDEIVVAIGDTADITPDRPCSSDRSDRLKLHSLSFLRPGA